MVTVPPCGSILIFFVIVTASFVDPALILILPPSSTPAAPSASVLKGNSKVLSSVAPRKLKSTQTSSAGGAGDRVAPMVSLIWFHVGWIGVSPHSVAVTHVQGSASFKPCQTDTCSCIANGRP